MPRYRPTPDSGQSTGAGITHPPWAAVRGATGSQPLAVGPPRPFFQPKEGEAGSKTGGDNEPTEVQAKTGLVPEEVALMKVTDLKDELARRGVSTHGT